MNKYLDGLAILLASAWVGGMWMTGYVAAPVLFQTLADKSLAGTLAGSMFAAIAYIGMFCAVYLLAYDYKSLGKRALRSGSFWIIALMLLFTLVGHFGIQPVLAQLRQQALPAYVMQSPYADSFKFWHGVSSIIFLVQSILGALLLLKRHTD